MANSVIKKVIIPKGSLPSVSSEQERYIVRYRIVSEDRNRVSHWSPQFLLLPYPLSLEDNSGVTMVSSPGFVTVSWVIPEATIAPVFDLCIAWGTSSGSVGLQEYVATVSGNMITVPVPSGKVSAQAFVQLPTYPKSYVERLVIARTAVQDL